jgi:L-alanine-DL-glutamate epimerase-like enolase superfamily enzyme
LLRIQTNQGIEGVSNAGGRARRETLQKLIGLNPFDLFAWKDDYYAGPSDKHRGLVDSLGGIDLAIFDILGKATDRPVADLFGPRLRHAVEVYDSTLYMDDLLTAEQREGLEDRFLRLGPHGVFRAELGLRGNRRLRFSRAPADRYRNPQRPGELDG